MSLRLLQAASGDKKIYLAGWQLGLLAIAGTMLEFQKKLLL